MWGEVCVNLPNCGKCFPIYIHIPNNHMVHLKFTQCYMSVIFTLSWEKRKLEEINLTETLLDLN